MQNLVDATEKEDMKTEVPVFNVGKTIKVVYKVI